MNDDKINDIEAAGHLRNRMIFVYTALLIVVYVTTCAFLINVHNREMKDRTKKYTSDMSLQLHKGVSNFLEDIEKSGVAIFSDEDYISYYPTDNKEKSYEEIQQEQLITEKLLTIGLTENFCDLGIMYRNGDHTGKISDGTLDIFGENMFEKLYDMAEEKNGSAWLGDYDSNSSRMYFIKKINENAVMLTSFYTTEFDNIFEKNVASSAAMIYFTDSKGNLLYSSPNTNMEIGEKMPEELAELFPDNESVSVVDDNYIGAVVQGEQGWKIYCCIKTETAITASADTDTKIIAIGFISLVVFIFTGFLISSKYTSHGSGWRKMMRSSDYIDSVTGLYNGLGVEEEISDRIETCLMGSTYAFVLVKIKDFELIRKRLGSDYTDEALKKLSEQLTASFGAKDIIGINEESEFVIFADFSDFDLFKAHTSLKERCNSVCSEFKSFYMGEEQDQKLYMAMGVCVYPENGKTFDELYESASKALELSMKAEKDSCIFYDSMKK